MQRLKRKYPPDPIYMHCYQPSYNWRNSAKGSGQHSLGREFVKYSPITPLTADNKPSMIEFEITNPRPLVCNEFFHFLVSPEFQYLDAADNTWKKMTSTAHKKQLIFAPNWFEKLFSSFEIIVNNQKVVTSVENYWVAQEFHGLLYYMMHKDLLQVVAPDPSNPAYMIPRGKDAVENATLAAQAGTVAAEIANIYSDLYADNYTFTYMPLFQFPWFQKPTLNLESPQVDLPIHKMDKMIIRIHFRTKQHLVWKSLSAATNPPTNDSDKFRVIFKRFDLLAEENIIHGTMAPLYGNMKAPKPSKTSKLIDFGGMFLDSKCELVPSGALEYKFRFNNTPMPEQMCIFALPKSVLNGTFDFSKNGSITSTSKYFSAHNILEVESRYNGLKFSNKTPNFEQLSDIQNTLNTLRALRTNGFFGMPVNDFILTYNTVAGEFAGGLYPMVFIDYTLANGSRQRRQPMGSDGHAFKTDQTLEILLKFKTSGTPGATADCIYCIYLFYSDKGMVWDSKNNKFINPLKRYL